mmetsp:Transcript_15047/g.20664  ORF Transcript_15047/g.20664 Transcript_15047/m.20664 type:complete len:120 (+) Transcript_15047:212-571(+)
MFTTYEELSKMHTAKLTYMAGMVDHNRDAFDFLVHDCKHMEHFIDDSTHYEQIGFCRAMLLLNNTQYKPMSFNHETMEYNNQLCIEKVIEFGHPKEYFLQTCGYDLQLWMELEYVISDM